MSNLTNFILSRSTKEKAMNFARRLFCRKEEYHSDDDLIIHNVSVQTQTDNKRTRSEEQNTPKKVLKSDDFEDLPTDYILSQDNDIGIQNECALCRDNIINSNMIGPFSRVGTHREVYVHELCARWTPDLLQYSDKESLYPPLRKFNVYLFKALHRSSSLRCAYCKEKGASIGCVEQSCRHSYHLHCAMKDKAIFLHVFNALHKNRVYSLIPGLYCRDCTVFQTLRMSTPKKPLLLSKMVKKKEIDEETLEDVYKKWNIVHKIIGERNTKQFAELEIQFYGNLDNVWMKTEQLPKNLVNEYCKNEDSTSESSENASEDSDHDNEVCMICGKASSPRKNPIVYCDGKRCDVAVHKNCYNIKKIPKGDWYCKRCSKKPSSNVDEEWQNLNCSRTSPEKKKMARLTTRDRHDIWEIILSEETHAKCPICRINMIKKESSFQCAHIDAKAKGCGKTANDEIWNMVPSCAKCNLSCNTKNLIDFMDSSLAMRPQIKPLLFLKVKNIILCKMEHCPLSTDEILACGNLTEVVKTIYNPERMRTISRLLQLTSSEKHNLFVDYEEPAPEQFYRKFNN